MRGASRRPQDFRVSTPITALVIHRLSDRGNKWVGLVSSVGRLDDGTKADRKGTKRRGFAKRSPSGERVDGAEGCECEKRRGRDSPQNDA